MNLNELLSAIRAEAAKKESSNIKTFILLKSIRDQESWKKVEFYEGTSFSTYSLVPFSVFIRDICGFSISWYENMQLILELRNGKALLKKYGFDNMITYLNTDKLIRKLILKKAEQCETTVNFRLIKNQIIPRKARRVNVIKDVVEEDQPEIEPVKVDRDLTRELSIQLDEAGERIENLKSAVSDRDVVIKNLKSQNTELVRDSGTLFESAKKIENEANERIEKLIATIEDKEKVIQYLEFQNKELAQENSALFKNARKLEKELEEKSNHTPSFLETITSGFFGGREARP